MLQIWLCDSIPVYQVQWILVKWKVNMGWEWNVKHDWSQESNIKDATVWVLDGLCGRLRFGLWLLNIKTKHWFIELYILFPFWAKRQTNNKKKPEWKLKESFVSLCRPPSVHRMQLIVFSANERCPSWMCVLDLGVNRHRRLNDAH